MFSFITQGFILLLSSSESLPIKYIFLHDGPCMVRTTLIDMNLVELKYYPFMISLNKCIGSCSVLPPKKEVNVKVINMITKKNEAKTMTGHISCDCKCKFNSAICNSNQKWNNKTCQYECKNYCKCKKDYSWNPRTSICEISKYWKSIADTSVTECDEIMIVMDIVSTKKTNTIATKKADTIATFVIITASVNCHTELVRDCCILHTFLLMIILLLIIIISIIMQNKKTQYKMENNEF